MSRDRTRETSREAYKELIESGALDGMRGEVWAWLYLHGPATRNEVARGIHKVPNDTSTRLKELVDMGNVREVGEDRCRVTGKNVILYDVTNQRHVGQRPANHKPKPEIIKPKCCADCPLVVEEEGQEVCWMDLTLPVDYEHRPARCRLQIRDVIIRGRL